MSSPSPVGDRRPVPTVAIVGNDVVLAAAPATPVQLAHACLRRGYSVAVPASWGDELVAAEVVRQLASRDRDRGPAVMCVCPYVRSRLLAPGPDLAPFLVSLVSPPVATARYLRTVYGEHGVHITYIGGCPSAADVTIDARLTPDDFLADLADHGIALSEQPLVFDSIVPPDRRRWWSLPGGVPSAEVLWSETDSRTLIEIDGDDASTDLAQHIITREHVLLDLAPSLGCVCSGAVGSVPSRGARVAVTALEPPRALGPIIDPMTLVTLEAPVETQTFGSGRATVAPSAEIAVVVPPSLESVLDEMLGADSGGTAQSVDIESDVATTVTVDEPLVLGPVSSIEGTALVESDTTPRGHAEVEEVIVASSSVSEGVERHEVLVEVPVDAPIAIAVEETMNATSSDQAIAVAATPTESSVRRRTPPAHPRYPTATIPKATGPDGRPLPRAYVAKRRTPPTGAFVIPAIASEPAIEPSIEPAATPVSSVRPEEAPAEPGGSAVTPAEPPVPTPKQLTPSGHRPVPIENAGASPVVVLKGAAERPAAQSAVGAGKSSVDRPIPPDGEPAAGPVATPAASQGALVFLLVTALLALAVFVLFSLRR